MSLDDGNVSKLEGEFDLFMSIPLTLLQLLNVHQVEERWL